MDVSLVLMSSSSRAELLIQRGEKCDEVTGWTRSSRMDLFVSLFCMMFETDPDS